MIVLKPVNDDKAVIEFSTLELEEILHNLNNYHADNKVLRRDIADGITAILDSIPVAVKENQQYENKCIDIMLTRWKISNEHIKSLTKESAKLLLDAAFRTGDETLKKEEELSKAIADNFYNYKRYDRSTQKYTDVIRFYTQLRKDGIMLHDIIYDPHPLKYEFVSYLGNLEITALCPEYSSDVIEDSISKLAADDELFSQLDTSEEILMTIFTEPPADKIKKYIKRGLSIISKRGQLIYYVPQDSFSSLKKLNSPKYVYLNRKNPKMIWMIWEKGFKGEITVRHVK